VPPHQSSYSKMPMVSATMTDIAWLYRKFMFSVAAEDESKLGGV
jgi:hypothetical protein